MIDDPFLTTCPQALVFDLDGTLLNSGLEITARTRRAMQACLKRNLPLILATSRAERSVLRLAGRELVEHCSLVLSNGALARAVAPLSGSCDYPLPDGVAGALVDYALELEPRIRVTLEITGFEFWMSHSAGIQELWEVNSATPQMLLSLDQALLRRPRKIAVGGLNRGLNGLAAALREKFSGKIDIYPSNQDTFLNIVGAGVSKSQAIGCLLESVGLPWSEVMVFGDDCPDLDMLTACGYPVAMANAADEVKAACRYLTLSNDQDGVAVVLERLLERPR